MKPNKHQKIAIIVAMGILLLMILCPPWYSRKLHYGRPTRYTWIWVGPRRSDGRPNAVYDISTRRLYAQFAALILLTAGALVVLKK